MAVVGGVAGGAAGATAAAIAAQHTSSYRVKFRRKEFLALVEMANPKIIYHRGRMHFFASTDLSCILSNAKTTISNKKSYTQSNSQTNLEAKKEINRFQMPGVLQKKVQHTLTSAGEKDRRILQLLNVGATVVAILVNALSNTSVIGEKNVGEISDTHPTLFTPAGYTFSIWGVIYTLLIAFTIYQALPKQQNKPFMDKINLLYTLSSLANIIWIVLWVYERIVLSTAIIFALLISLIAIYLRLDIGRTKVELIEKLAVHLPFSVYLGWITVAAIANVAVSLTVINWDGWGLSEIFWTVLMIGVAVIVTLLVTFMRRDVGYSLVIVWALAGIVSRQVENLNILLAASIGSTLIFSALIVKILVLKKRTDTKKIHASPVKKSNGSKISK